VNDETRARLVERQEVLTRIRRLLIEMLNVPREPDEIDPDAPLFGTGLSLDSIDGVELVVSMEEVFGVRLGDEVMARAQMRTVNSLVDYILSRKTPLGIA
jgi:acyl carrier protein